MSHDADRHALARALQALPDFAPPADGWARLAQRRGRAPVAARSGGARPAIAFAIAAGTLAFATLTLWPLLNRPSPPAAAPVAGTGPAAADLAARSAGLERLLEALPPTRSARASTALTAALLEDRIALVDERLSATAGEAPSPDATQALLRERVVLLDSLVRVRYATSVGQTL